MRREDIEATEWAAQLWESATPSSYREIIKRMAIQTPVFIAWMGDSAEITLGSYTIHSTKTMEEALMRCRRFELPVQVMSGNAYAHTLQELIDWLGEQGNDKTRTIEERAAYFNVQAKVNQLMREAK